MVTFEFQGYPFTKRRRVQGTIEVRLEESIGATHDKTGQILIPLQRPLKWTIEKISPRVKWRRDLINMADLQRWIIGNYRYTIESSLYAIFAREQGRPDLADRFEMSARFQLPK